MVSLPDSHPNTRTEYINERNKKNISTNIDSVQFVYSINTFIDSALCNNNIELMKGDDNDTLRSNLRWRKTSPLLLWYIYERSSEYTRTEAASSIKGGVAPCLKYGAYWSANGHGRQSRKRNKEKKLRLHTYSACMRGGQTFQMRHRERKEMQNT